MKYKKYIYIIVLILTLMLGTNRTYALEPQNSKGCYYMSDDGNFKTRMTIYWNYEYDEWYDYIIGWISGLGQGVLTPDGYTKVVVDRAGKNNNIHNKEYIANWFKAINTDECIADDSVCFGYIYKNAKEANNSSATCPKYVVFQESKQYWVWATDSESKAKSAVDRINAQGFTGFYGKQTTSEKYFDEYIEEGLMSYDKNGNLTCADFDSIFGSKDDENSIRYMINSILNYVRIIVPILIILLGTLDFAKAVMAGKEDNMKKAQSDFVKRLIAGVAVFFVPALVNVVMELADIVWAGEYFHCPL